MSASVVSKTQWGGRFWYFAVYFLFALLMMLAWRYAIFAAYKPADLASSSFFDSLHVGLRLDAKWLATLLVPGWLLLLVSARFPVLWKAGKGWIHLAFFVIVVTEAINFGFYGFYGSTINSTIFGLWYDDTEAIFKTLWKDWPIASYVIALMASCSVPCLAARFIPCPVWLRRVGLKTFLVLFVVGSIGTFLMMRGNLGTFPLRLQDFVASPHPYVNAVIPNGPAGLYYAYKEQKTLSLGTDPARELKAHGFATPDAARNAIAKLHADVPAPTLSSHPNHVVFCLMESMGIDEFDSYVAGTNDTLGQLAQAIEFPNAVIFRHALSVGNGTFPSLEGLLFDTPISPLSQTKYGREKFSFSRPELFHQAGYETIFLSSGSTQWHDLNKTLPLHGFDRTIGAVDIRAQYPEAEYSTWGVGDQWTFEVAKKLLADADRRGKKLFLFILTATNHPPYVVPANTQLKPVDPASLPPFVVRRPETKIMLETFQYAADALGGFVHWLEKSPMGTRTLAVATGDHNARLTYNDGAVWPHIFGVPALFWLPEDLQSVKAQAQPDKWIAHRDLFPTIEALILGRTPEIQEGRNLFAPLPVDMATSWTAGEMGAVIGAQGAVQMRRDGTCAAYNWAGERLLPAKDIGVLKDFCTFGWAQRTLADYKIRAALIPVQKSASQK